MAGSAASAPNARDVAAPQRLTLARHRDLKGRERNIWYRRALFLVLIAIIVLALLNVFGQKPSSSRANSPAAALDVYSPSTVRGGLVFNSRFTVDAHQPLKTPKLVFDSGWFEQMTINGNAPQPSTQTTRDGKVVMTFDSLQPGQKLVFWMSFQANPTNIGHRAENVQLDDGNTPLVKVRRSITIFP
jgi:hypothetical protein